MSNLIPLTVSVIALVIAATQTIFQRYQAQHAPMHLQAQRDEAASAELMTRIAVMPVIALQDIRLLWYGSNLSSISGELANLGSGSSVDLRFKAIALGTRPITGQLQKVIPLVIPSGQAHAFQWRADSILPFSGEKLRVVLSFNDVLGTSYVTTFDVTLDVGRSGAKEIRMAIKHGEGPAENVS